MSDKIELTPEEYKRITRKHRSIPKRIRDEVTERDNDRCVKCGRYKHLELHHIIPAYLGGKEVKHNLITLCKTCHKDAPDNPVEFFKWASKSLPPNLEQSLELTKIVIALAAFDDDIMKKMNDLKKSYNLENAKGFSENDIFEWVESFYNDMWKVYISNDIKHLSIFFGEYIPKNLLKDKQKEDN